MLRTRLWRKLEHQRSTQVLDQATSGTYQTCKQRSSICEHTELRFWCGQHDVCSKMDASRHVERFVWWACDCEYVHVTTSSTQWLVRGVRVFSLRILHSQCNSINFDENSNTNAGTVSWISSPDESRAWDSKTSGRYVGKFESSQWDGISFSYDCTRSSFLYVESMGISSRRSLFFFFQHKQTIELFRCSSCSSCCHNRSKNVVVKRENEDDGMSPHERDNVRLQQQRYLSWITRKYYLKWSTRRRNVSFRISMQNTWRYNKRHTTIHFGINSVSGPQHWFRKCYVLRYFRTCHPWSKIRVNCREVDGETWDFEAGHRTQHRRYQQKNWTLERFGMPI